MPHSSKLPSSSRYHVQQVLEECQPRLRELLQQTSEDWDADTGLFQVHHGSWREIRPGIIDREAIDWYRYGNCALLALFLHRISGWPLMIISAQKEKGSRMVHAICQTPNGQLIDIEGTHDPKDELESWRRSFPNAYLERMASERDFLDIVGDDFTCYMEHELALTEDFAYRLYAKYSI